MSRPTKLPSWCDDDAASKVVEMGSTKKLAGFLYKERMPFQYLNWLFRHFVKWFTHYDENLNQFDPYESATPDEFLNVSAGRVNSGTGVVVKAVQQIDFSTFYPTTASTSRIDRVVIDNLTGVIARVAGTEAGSPTVPAIPDNKSPICQILVDENTASVTSSMITDERSVVNQSAYSKLYASQSATGAIVSFTDIPDWTKKITINLSDVSAAVTFALFVQIGDSGGDESTGYESDCMILTTGANSTSSQTTSFQITSTAAISDSISGSCELSLLDDTTNEWVMRGAISNFTDKTMFISAGKKALSGKLDRLSVFMISANLNAGNISILCER